MLYYLVIYFFIVRSFAQEVLQSDGPKWGYPLEVPEGGGFESPLEMAETPKNTSSLISNLIGGNGSASTLLSQLVNVNLKNVGKVIVLVEDLIKKGNHQIRSLEYWFRADKRRYEYNRPLLENQVKILHQVLNLLAPIGKLTRNKVYQIFSRVEMTFDVSFDLYINSYGGGEWLSVFHMTTGSNHGTSGSRIPAVWVNGPGKYLCLVSEVNGNTNYWKHYDVKLKTWYHVQIKQVQNPAKGMIHTILVNNKVISSLVNKKPRNYKNVKVFVADPWYPALDGHIKNIQIITP